jgi:hypothetical protein
MITNKNPTAWALPQNTRNVDAVFIGWQPTRSGEVFALYDITARGHPLLGSTVTHKTLHMLNLHIPGGALPEGPVKKY